MKLLIIKLVLWDILLLPICSNLAHGSRFCFGIKESNVSTYKKILINESFGTRYYLPYFTIRTFFTSFEDLTLKDNPLSLLLHNLMPGDILLCVVQLVTDNTAGQHQYKCCFQPTDLNHLVPGIGIQKLFFKLVWLLLNLYMPG